MLYKFRGMEPKKRMWVENCMYASFWTEYEPRKVSK